MKYRTEFLSDFLEISLSEISNRICAPNKTENVNLSAFNLLTRAKFDSKKCNSNLK